MSKVSVIIAIYNVEQYLPKCLHTLFSQTLKDIEYIFIDDASPDNSIEILKNILNQYPNRQHQVKIIHHQQNLGVANARATGIKEATGEYIIHCDPDDWVDLDIYEFLLKKAKHYDADIVECEFYNKEKKGDYNYKEILYPQAKDLIKKWVKTKNDYSSLCNKLIKRNLFIENEIYPYPGINKGEDFSCMFRILYYAQKYLKINKGLYHYNKRNKSLTQQFFTIKDFNSLIYLVENIINFFNNKNDFSLFINYTKFHFKMKGRHLYNKNQDEWYSLFRECHKDILKFSDHPLKVRLIWYFLLSHQIIFKYSKYLYPRLF